MGPYRIEATAYGLQPGFQVFLDEDETPWMHISIVSPTQFILKGGDKLRAGSRKSIPSPSASSTPTAGR